MNSTSSTSQVCPYLGLEDDIDSSHAFASEFNYCHRGNPIAQIRHSHQNEFCLNTKHTTCPIYLRVQKGPLPRHIAQHNYKKKSTDSARTILAVIIAFIALTVIFFYKQNLFMKAPQPTDKTEDASQVASTSSTETPTPEFFTQITPTIIVGTPTLHLPVYGSITVTSPPTLTATIPPTKFISRHQLDIPIGTNQKFILHRLAANEKLDSHAQQYNTSIEAITAINYYLYLTNPVQRDVLIIFPLNTTDVTGLPVLDIYQVTEDERGDNYADLAQILHVDLTDLKYYNGITDPSDRPLVGDYLLIPQKRIVP